MSPRALMSSSILCNRPHCATKPPEQEPLCYEKRSCIGMASASFKGERVTGVTQECFREELGQ